ncbi:large subunit ribosomal protein L35 [Metschnikowia aff. pulcherrima]|uniref:Large ribosomal subunit protein mL38 n=1 Tax=Metschnikowia aff. pulcherrima TaxID=2163413 RepID=A0A4P6XPB6_9ASCO|nr:large subunit ribosomal protein L35 [Metschnikowia aff. pulcherrima]
MSLRFFRLFSLSSRSLGAWSELGKRLPLLTIRDEFVRKSVFEGIPPSGPPLIVLEEQREAYHSPEAIDETFASAYELLEQNLQEKYRVLELKKADMTAKEIEEVLVAAEKHNPEVLYNTRFQQDQVDRAHPVYRRFLQEKWELHDLMVIMQRLEQHHVIPDTLPTIEPRADVRVKFGHNTSAEFGDWVIPGTKLPAFAVASPPTIEIQEFETVENSTGLYSVLLVNPDVPDLTRNSFQTSLNLGLYNVPLTFTDNIISPEKILTNPEFVFQQYTPLVPEKNAPTQRACLWVFRQGKALKNVKIDGARFDIRAFTEEHELQAVGAHMWRQEFDRSVAQVRQDYGLPRGRVFDPVRGTEPLM